MSASPLTRAGRQESGSPGRVALVTGAARGIGAATVQALLQRGYSVLAIDSCAGEGPGRPAGVDYPLADRSQLEALERIATLRGIAELIVHAQLPAERFYRGRGYAAEGAAFEEQGVPHVLMRKVLPR